MPARALAGVVLAALATDASLAQSEARAARIHHGRVLPADGTCRILVYMMRSVARRNESANYRLQVIRGG